MDRAATQNRRTRGWEGSDGQSLPDLFAVRFADDIEDRVDAEIELVHDVGAASSRPVALHSHHAVPSRARIFRLRSRHERS